VFKPHVAFSKIPIWNSMWHVVISKEEPKVNMGVVRLLREKQSRVGCLQMGWSGSPRSSGKIMPDSIPTQKQILRLTLLRGLQSCGLESCGLGVAWTCVASGQGKEEDR
jgi:hypothetical protein